MKFKNLILSPSHFVPIYIKKIQAKFEQDWIIFRGSSMPLKFCIMSHMRYQLPHEMNMNPIFKRNFFVPWLFCNLSLVEVNNHQAHEIRYKGRGYVYPFDILPLWLRSEFICTIPDIVACGQKWKDSLMHMLYCSRLMYSTWIPTKYKKAQRSALIIEFALILLK